MWNPLTSWGGNGCDSNTSVLLADFSRGPVSSKVVVPAPSAVDPSPCSWARARHGHGKHRVDAGLA